MTKKAKAPKTFTIDPADFSDGAWEEMYNASTIMPRTMENRDRARPFKRSKKYITLAIQVITNRVEEVSFLYKDNDWVADLEEAAETLRKLIGPEKVTKKAATDRLYDLLTSDIYTDAEEYEDRVGEIHHLIPIVFRGYSK